MTPARPGSVPQRRISTVRPPTLFEGISQVSNGTRQAPLAMDAETFRGLGHRLVDQLAELLESVPRGPVTHDESPSAVREALGLDGGLPEAGSGSGGRCSSGPLPAVRALALQRAPAVLRLHHRAAGADRDPRRFPGLGAERQRRRAGRWRRRRPRSKRRPSAGSPQLIGYPGDCGGLLVSGGNMANIVCFLAARAATARLERAGARRRRGIRSKAARLRIRRDAHVDSEGGRPGRPRHRVDPMDSDRRGSADGRRRAPAADRVGRGRGRRAVPGRRHSRVGQHRRDRSAAEIACVCHEHGAWFHVDGAYGGFAAAVPDAPDDLRALTEADSVAVDPHKWLYAPLEAGCALVRDPEALRAAFAYHPPYYHFEEQRNELRGLRSAELARLPRAQGVAGAAGTPARRAIAADDRGRHPAVAARWPTAVERHAGARAVHAGA